MTPDNTFPVQSLQSLQDYQSPLPTSMVSLLIPPGTNIEKLRTRLTSEIATSVNIKDKTNRLSVGNALSKINEHLKYMRVVPETGIAIYSEQHL